MNNPGLAETTDSAIVFEVVSSLKDATTGVVQIRGEVDIYTSPRLKSAVIEHFEKGCKSLIIDLSKVDYLDSSGLGVLVTALKRSKERGGDISVIVGSARVARILQVTRLDKIFRMEIVGD